MRPALPFIILETHAQEMGYSIRVQTHQEEISL